MLWGQPNGCPSFTIWKLYPIFELFNKYDKMYVRQKYLESSGMKLNPIKLEGYGMKAMLWIILQLKVNIRVRIYLDIQSLM